MTAVVLSAALILSGVDGSLWDEPVQAFTPAVRVAEGVCLATDDVCHPPTTPPPPLYPAVSGPCAEWASVAFETGWPVSQWPTLARVMWCESRCNPTARNRSGASGLMQVMPMWWHGRDPLDPATNLTMAREVYRAQGWHAWSCY